MTKYAAPIFPNAGVDAWYRIQLQNHIVVPMAQDMLDTVRRVWESAGGAMDARPKLSISVLMQRALQRWGTKWGKKMDSAGERIATNFAMRNRAATELAMKKTLADAGFTVKFRSTAAIRQAFDAVKAENVGLIKSIPQEFLTDVESQVWAAVRDGGNMRELADGIVRKYQIAHKRAALIARDQNHKAKAAIERTRRLDVGITDARWKHSHAGKEYRPTHVAMDGKTYSIAKGMYDSAVNKNIWPGTEINCRCTDEAAIPGFE